MFRALATIEARPRAWALTHSNDNFEHRKAAPARAGARRLVCRWQTYAPNGRLECRWQVEQPDGGAEQSPGPVVHPVETCAQIAA